MIQIGQTLPDVQLSQRTSEGTLTQSVTTLFANKKVV
ncbi:peroxiredoxin, partial [Vibrio cholerae]|nr:peroxiredoxin [Vibrio cholerae]